MTILRRRMTEDMKIRNLSPHTQASYLQQVTQFACYFGKSPDLLGPEEIRTYQIYLTNEKKLAPGSIHIAIAALRFFYKVTLKRDWTFEEVLPLPKKPQKLPVILSPEEVLHFLPCVKHLKHRVILTTCYAAGLRISEAIRLKAAAIGHPRRTRQRQGIDNILQSVFSPAARPRTVRKGSRLIRAGGLKTCWTEPAGPCGRG